MRWLLAFLDEAAAPALVLALAMMSHLEIGANQERALYERGRQTSELQNAKPSPTNTETGWLGAYQAKPCGRDGAALGQAIR